jgi:hypothetical protein
VLSARLPLLARKRLAAAERLFRVLGLSGGSELEAMDRQAEGELAQRWMGSATYRRQCLACGRWIGHVAGRSGLRKEGDKTGTEGNEARKVKQLVDCGRFVYWELGYKQDKKRCGRSAGVVLGN